VDIEEIQTTRTEKLLAVVLAIFLLTGGVWAYQEIDDWIRDEGAASGALSSPAIDRNDEARNRLARANEARAAAREELELRREAYRTALDADRPADRLERAYRNAERAFEAAERERTAAQRAVRATAPAAEAAQQRLAEQAEERRRREERNIFFARMALAIVALALAFVLLWHLHGRASRYLPLAFAAVMSATLLAFILAGDYLTDYFDPLDLGPLLLSLIGSTAAVVTFYLVQRYLARRLPARRVRKEQCPFCGYPARGNDRCENCGREVVAPCAKCAAPRRVGVLHCGTCGAM
jgi:hypothetical protein